MAAPERAPQTDIESQNIHRVFIANRGEIAVRAAKTFAKRGIEVVIPYSNLASERESLAARTADAHIDDNWDLAAIGGIAQEESYKNPHIIIENAKLNGCDTIFPGYGFLSENADFREMCDKEGLRILAPTTETMRLTGNKVNAKELARKTRIKGFRSIPVVEGFPLRTSLAPLLQDVAALGGPVMIKDPDKGGGEGNRIATNREEAQNAYEQLRFGENKGLFVERYIKNAIHVEVQIAGDKHGNVISLGERDCTLQRDHQKIVEESPSPHIQAEARQQMQEAAVAIGKNATYTGVGTVEFIFDRDANKWYFMEINPRIQVEHPVTEEQTGLDIIGLMIDIEEGKRLPPQETIRPQGHTIEVRLYAEDPTRNFEQQEGTLHTFNLPEDMEGIRIDKGYEQGDEVSTWYDPTLAKIIAHGATREEALHRLDEALDRAQIAGVKTNREFLIQLINTPEFRQGNVTTKFVEAWWGQKQQEARLERYGIAELLGENGVFTRFPPSRVLDEPNFPVNPTIKTANSARPMTRREYMQGLKERTQKECGSEYGILERDGVRCVTYALDPNFNLGTVGKEEGWMFEDALKLAHKLNLPFITLTSTAGQRNYENTQALGIMPKNVFELVQEWPPLFHIDLRYGYVFGGPPVSYADNADLIMATYSMKNGITGPYAVAIGEGLKPTDKDGNPSTGADDSYRALDQAFGEGSTHTATRHYEKRTGVDILVTDLKEAGDKLTHILHIAKKRHPQIATDNEHRVFRPKERIGYLPMPHPVTSYNSPDTPFPSWIPPRISQFWERVRQRGDRRQEIIFEKPLRVSERRRIIKHPDRPTAVDIIDTESRLFTDAALLSNVFDVNGLHQTLPIISALTVYRHSVTNEEFPLFIIAQQPQQKIKEDGTIELFNEPIRPEDWRAMRRMLNFAEKLDFTVVEMGNTSGASARRADEDKGQQIELAQTMARVVSHKGPIASVGYGLGGSGGVVPLVWPADAAAAWELFTLWVADVPAMRNFIERSEYINEDTASEAELRTLDEFADQFHDATAEGQFESYQIDDILKEGPGGAHLNPSIIIGEMARWFDKILPDLQEKYIHGRIMEERAKRKARASAIGAKVNPDYQGEINKLAERFNIPIQ